MISVELECDFPSCTAGTPEEHRNHGMMLVPSGESVDVYLDDWNSGAKLSGYLPDGWTVRERTYDGLAAVWCPAHPEMRGEKL